MKLFSRQYWFFKNKIRNVQATIWETEFKISKSRQVREGVRQDRDRAMEALNQIDAQLKGTVIDAARREQGEKDKVVLTENVKRFEAQMKMVDTQINGAVGSETQEAVIGLLEQVKSYVELMSMYKAYLREI